MPNRRAEVCFLITCLLILTCEGQLHFLKYINSGTNPSPLAPAQFNSTLPEESMSNTRNQFTRADRICIQGMWALYNTSDYGQGAEDKTTVISVRGTDINTCTRSGQVPVLKNVQSVHYLGSSNYANDGLLIYTQPYMLGGLWNVTVEDDMAQPLPPGINGFALGSIAITGSKSWVICGDTHNPCDGVCVNMRNFGNMFLQRNTPGDNTIQNGWPKTVRKVEIVSSEECENYPNPPPIRLIKRSLHENIEVRVFSPALRNRN